MMSDFVANGPAPPPASSGPVLHRMEARRLAVHLAGMSALALVLVTSGAFDSDDLSLGRRLLMFGTISFLLVVQASVLADAARRLWRPYGLGAVVAVAATWILMTIEIHVLKATPIVPYAPDPLPEFALFLMPFVVPVSLLVLGVKWADRGACAPRVEDAPGTPPGSAFDAAPEACDDAMDGWPRQPVRRVQAVDHYLQLWTCRGPVLLRGRMRDALRRLPAGAGVRIHRSWWVALSEIDRLERRKRDYVLRLKNGDRVPVARARVDEVRRSLCTARDSAGCRDL